MAAGSARGRVKTSVTKVSLADLRRASMEIHEATRALYELVLGKRIPPAWDRPGRPLP